MPASLGVDGVSLQELAELRQVAYRLFAQAFLPPSAERLDELMPVLATLRADGGAFRDFAFFALWDQFLGLLEETACERLDPLSARYVRLFHASTEPLIAPPFESAITAGSAEEGAEKLAKLEIEYAAAGLMHAKVSGEEPDHVAVELEFLGFLCGREARWWNRGAARQALRELRVERRFLEEHLCRWLPELSFRLQSADPGGFYAQAAATAEAYATHDLELVAVLAETLSEQGRDARDR